MVPVTETKQEAAPCNSVDDAFLRIREVQTLIEAWEGLNIPPPQTIRDTMAQVPAAVGQGDVKTACQLLDRVLVLLETLTTVELGEARQEGENILTFKQRAWGQRIDAALAPSHCEQVSGARYGSLYYSGALIDTHYHIPHLPDHSLWDSDEVNTDGVRPLLGANINLADIVCTLEQDTTAKVFAFFPVFPEISQQLLEVASRAMQAYPDKFVPFIMPPDDDISVGGFPTVTAEVLKEMLDVHPGLFKGYGEIGLYARSGGALELPPDSQRLFEIYPVIREHRLLVYVHLGVGHKDNFERVLERNRDINFIWHGDQLSVEEVEEVISSHPNVYYTIDELYGDEFLLRPEVSKEMFLKHLANYEVLLQKDLATWKSVIERHPDQFMWGTDRSDRVVWSHDPEVGQALSNYARAFIAGLAPHAQEKFAYLNANRLVGASGLQAGP